MRKLRKKKTNYRSNGVLVVHTDVFVECECHRCGGIFEEILMQDLARAKLGLVPLCIGCDPASLLDACRSVLV